MFKLSTLNTFWRSLTLTEQTGPEATDQTEIKLKLQFKRLPLAELQRRTAADSTEAIEDFMRDVLVGWRDVASEDGQPLAFNAESRDALLGVGGMANTLFGFYLREVGALREKN